MFIADELLNTIQAPSGAACFGLNARSQLHAAPDGACFNGGRVVL